MEDTNYIGVQFASVGKHYHFSVPSGLDVQEGDFVVVNTSRGIQLGKVAQKNVEPRNDGGQILSVERIATADDHQAFEENKEKGQEAVKIINRFLKDNEYGEIKAVDAEYTLDRAKMTIYMTYEQDVDFDIRSFLREVSKHFYDTRLEVRQVGPRDVAKMISGLGACGIEKRCCSRFLSEFSSISIKMAKAQDISLTPSEITGICGRLRCCLRYENETYEAALKQLPKRKKMVMTPLGEGRVTQVLPLSESVIVNLPEIGPRHFTLEELETGVMQVKPVVFEEEKSQYDLGQTDVEFLKIETDRQTRHKKSSGRGKSGRSGETKEQTSSEPTRSSQKKRGEGSRRGGKKDGRPKKDKDSSKAKSSDAKLSSRSKKTRGPRPPRNAKPAAKDN